MEITKELTINASADKVWQIVGTDFDNVSVWASPVITSEHNSELADGEMGRVCDVQGAGKVVENVYEYSDDDRKLAFTLEGGKFPFFVKRIKNVWHVEPKGDDQAVVHVGVNIDLMSPFKQLVSGRMSKAIGKNADNFLGELKYYAENDEPLAVA